MIQKNFKQKILIIFIVLPALLVTLSSFYFLLPAGQIQADTVEAAPMALTRQAQEYDIITFPANGRLAENKAPALPLGKQTITQLAAHVTP